MAFTQKRRLAGKPQLTELGRPTWVYAVPVLLSEDVEGARTIAAGQLSFYESIPSYRNVIAREDLASVADLAAIGPEETVVRQLRRYLDAGATDAVISPLDRSASVDREALWRLTAAL